MSGAWAMSASVNQRQARRVARRASTPCAIAQSLPVQPAASGAPVSDGQPLVALRGAPRAIAAVPSLLPSSTRMMRKSPG